MRSIPLHNMISLMRRACLVAAGCGLACMASTAIAQPGQVPPPGRDLGVNDNLIGQYVPQDIQFTDDQGNVASLGSYLNRGKPVMLSFNYSDCPTLCNTQLSNMALRLKLVPFVPGEDFEIVSISIDPLEQTARARQSKDKFVAYYDRPETADGWHFLTGDKFAIKSQADSVGVSYRYIPESKSYSHSAVFILLAPDGKIVRYIYGLDFEPDDLKLALVEAAEGKIGSPINYGTYLTGCFVYDEFSGKYTFRWMTLMRWAGGFTVGIIGIVAVSLEVRRRFRLRANSGAEAGEPNPANIGPDSTDTSEAVD